jgi:hypothetical protein
MIPADTDPRMQRMPANPPALMRLGSGKAWAAVLGLVGLLAVPVPASAFELITEKEAALPPDQLPPLQLRGSPTRRPSVTVVVPEW